MTQTEELIAKAGASSNIPTHPDDQFAATCIDIIDMGMVEMTWQGQTREKHRIILRFFCGEYFYNEKGEQAPLWVDKWLTFSLHENSAMRPFLENWRGKKFTDAELHDGFNVAKLLHVPAFIQVTHNVTAEKTYANIASIMKLPKSLTAPGVPDGYVRVKDRPPKEKGGNGQSSSGKSDDAGYGPDDDMPF